MSRIKRLVVKDCLGIKELAFNPGRVNYISGGNGNEIATADR